jgi:hypothetical protein
MYKKKLIIGLFTLTIVGITFWTINRQDDSRIQQIAHESAIKDNTTTSIASNEEGLEVKDSVEEISSDNIYGTFEDQYSWTVDPSIPENLMDDRTSIVHLKVLAEDEARMLPKKDNFSSPTPFTPYEVEIIETISGNPLSGHLTVYVRGGNLKISKFIESTPERQIEKMGLNKLSNKEKDSKYLAFTSATDYKLKPGKEYALLLSEPADNIYTVNANGYGIFYKIKTKNGETKYKNVLTEKESNLKFKKTKQAKE